METQPLEDYDLNQDSIQVERNSNRKAIPSARLSSIQRKVQGSIEGLLSAKKRRVPVAVGMLRVWKSGQSISLPGVRWAELRWPCTVTSLQDLPWLPNPASQASGKPCYHLIVQSWFMIPTWVPDFQRGWVHWACTQFELLETLGFYLHPHWQRRQV